MNAFPLNKLAARLRRALGDDFEVAVNSRPLMDGADVVARDRVSRAIYMHPIDCETFFANEELATSKAIDTLRAMINRHEGAISTSTPMSETRTLRNEVDRLRRNLAAIEEQKANACDVIGDLRDELHQKDRDLAAARAMLKARQGKTDAPRFSPTNEELMATNAALQEHIANLSRRLLNATAELAGPSAVASAPGVRRGPVIYCQGEED